MTTHISETETRPQHAAALPEELRACTGFLLSRVGAAMKATVIDAFEREGFGMYEYAVLAVLAEGAKETQATIADTLEVDRGQLVGVLDELEQRGQIERRRDPNDRRRHTVSMTPAGKKQLVKMRAIVQRVEDSFMESLDAKARAGLQAALLRIAENRDFRFQKNER